MILKTTFKNDIEANSFFASNVDKNGLSIIYIIKYIIVNNPVTRDREQHLIYSVKDIMRSGMHLRKGVEDKV